MPRCRASHRVFAFLAALLVLSTGPQAVQPSVGSTDAPTIDLRSAAAATSKTIDLKPAAAATSKYQVHVSPKRYLSHIALLAHDELKGRKTGQPGIDLAAGYIAGQFAAAGLEPGGGGGTYFQEFTFGGRSTLQDETKLIIEGQEPIEPVLREDFIPFSFSAKGDFEGDLVFVGYGITNAEEDHDDYDGMDVTDKVVLMLRREPAAWQEEGFTDHAYFRTKVPLAAEHGAVAVLIVNQDPGEDGIDRLMRFGRGEGPYDLPAMHVKRELAGQLLSRGGLGSLTGLQQQLDEEGKHVSGPCPGVAVRGTVAYEATEILGRNVIGILVGTGPHADEYIVIGGHYDHVGEGRNGIRNGADDNASGTAGVIELAWAFSQTPDRDRSVIFMTFAGEEDGLRGSAHFCADPTVEIDSIVAMLNMDMIGRHDPDSERNGLEIMGLGTGDSFKRIVAEHAEALDMEYSPQDSAQGGSDQSSFYNYDVPAMFFFTGIHPDYHQVGDDTEKIHADNAARIVELVYYVAADLVNEADPPVFAKVDRPARIGRGPRQGGVVMGIMPDIEDDPEKKGWRVTHVSPDGGADKAGMKAHDQIVEIDGRTINGMREYREATAGKKPGDVLSVTVLRGDEELVLQVELSAR